MKKLNKKRNAHRSEILRKPRFETITSNVKCKSVNELRIPYDGWELVGYECHVLNYDNINFIDGPYVPYQSHVDKNDTSIYDPYQIEEDRSPGGFVNNNGGDWYEDKNNLSLVCLSLPFEDDMLCGHIADV